MPYFLQSMVVCGSEALISSIVQTSFLHFIRGSIDEVSISLWEKSESPHRGQYTLGMWGLSEHQHADSTKKSRMPFR